MSDSDTPLSIERPLSLRQILRLNSRERLLVPPLRWTDRHLELLRCSFDEPCPAAPCTQADTREYSGRVFNNLVLSQWKMGAREGHVPGILTEADCPLKRGPRLNFWFNSRCAVALLCSSFLARAKSGSGSPSPPVAAYIDLQRPQYTRSEVLTPYCGTNRRGRDLTGDLYTKMLKHITPKEPTRDPYIAAVLIALAQKQRRLAGTDSNGSRRLKFLPKVLVSSLDRKCAHIYSAEVSSHFLDWLAYPAIAPSTPASMVIRITAVPYEPHISLRHRLFALLLSSENDGLDTCRTSPDDTVLDKPAPLPLSSQPGAPIAHE
ncbi:hypothetical protein G6O67_001881 [Ophiocordyceps sinensis]|uniref:Uncharacterized protein n=1 Tax=Ophiocordyceps sinensis TaxID=72228 RepID=A0A8H4PT40_9HYPO|nr:hypothetical protein G6O67_001881 [Ophiocordyceps sinensis]